MNRDDALRMLASDAAGERLLAANFFLINATDKDANALSVARTKEVDIYVRHRIDQAISILAGQQVITEPDLEFTQEEVHDAELLAKATEWVGGVILHEMESHLGRAALYASREVEDYENSRTRIEVEGLRTVFRGISQLVAASKPARPVQVDLASVVVEIAESLGGDVSLIGPRPLLVMADRTLLALAITNGLKNAIEAGSAASEPHPVVVNWGATDRDYWISILDKGLGVSGSSKSKFKVGATTKPGHSGFGLAVAKRVMQAMDGQVGLDSQPGGGALYELRWRRPA